VRSLQLPSYQITHLPNPLYQILQAEYDNWVCGIFLMSPGPVSSASSSKAAFQCSLCGNTAAVVEILPPEHERSLSNNHSTIRVSGFIGEERVVLSESSESALRACLARADSAALYALEQLWAPFYCPACDRVYCVKHWTVVPEYDQEFFDHSYGYCPEGHRRLIED
jgi:hypothetical protein